MDKQTLLKYIHRLLLIICEAPLVNNGTLSHDLVANDSTEAVMHQVPVYLVVTYVAVPGNNMLTTSHTGNSVTNIAAVSTRYNTQPTHGKWLPDHIKPSTHPGVR